jgi:hypothetical protein
MSEAVDVLRVMKSLASLAFESGAEEGPEGNEPAYRLHQDAVTAVEAVADMKAAIALLLESAPPHMTPRNAKEREAYKRIRAAFVRIGGA